MLNYVAHKDYYQLCVNIVFCKTSDLKSEWNFNPREVVNILVKTSSHCFSMRIKNSEKPIGDVQFKKIRFLDINQENYIIFHWSIS